MHGCEATWVEFVPIREMFQRELVRGGEVQVFDVTGHLTATRCYTWSHATEGTKRRLYAVLHVTPITDAVVAVRASMVADALAKK